MKKDVEITFVEGVSRPEKNQIIKRLLEEICRETGVGESDLSSIPRLFGTDADTDVLSAAYERLPKSDRDKIESVSIFEDAA